MKNKKGRNTEEKKKKKKKNLGTEHKGGRQHATPYFRRAALVEREKALRLHDPRHYIKKKKKK